MVCHITVILDNGDTHDFELSRAAQDWLGREFDAAGCVPTNPVGKLLLADKILVLAKTQVPKTWSQPTQWLKDFLRAAAASLGRPLLTIDLASHTLGY
jgi:hypothetical protein